MNIAAITITYNDDYKFKEWTEHFLDYKDEIFVHIIVDNKSKEDYKQKLKESFKQSHIIFRNSNGGCTGAYNDGIKYALSIPEVDAVMLIGNDIKLEKGASTILYKALFSNPDLGMIAPALLKKDSDIVDDFGCEIKNDLSMQEYSSNKKYDEIKNEIHFCSALTGGMNMAKREFYEKVGFQDENLFMYSDEVDIGIRGAKLNFKFVSVGAAVSWHQHINENKKSTRRHSYTKYLMGRNKVYVAKKHFGIARVTYVFLFYFFGSFYRILQNIVKGNFHIVKDYIWVIFGTINGLIGNMKPNKYSQPLNRPNEQ